LWTLDKDYGPLNQAFLFGETWVIFLWVEDLCDNFHIWKRNSKMASKLIHAQTDEQGILNLTVKGLPPGEVDVILLTSENKTTSKQNAQTLPLGGHKAGWLAPEQLRRESMYEDEV
jgi:hypothetical protein